MAIRQMTKNEYQGYMKELASKVYNAGLSWEQYKAKLNEVEILPLDLSAYPAIKEKTAKLINALFTEEDTDRNGNYMLRGFTRQESAEVNALGCSFGDYADCYSFFAYNAKEYFIYTYCEGDTTLTLYPDAESYRKGYEETYAWYKEASA